MESSSKTMASITGTLADGFSVFCNGTRQHLVAPDVVPGGLYALKLVTSFELTCVS
jgi:hypothetical protein